MSSAAQGDHPLRDVLLLLVLIAAFLLPSFATRDLWEPDEPRYMEVAREMAALKDYLLPHLAGSLYAEKPPLFFWCAAGFYRLGCGYNSGRIVAALASTGTLLLTYFMARRFLPPPGPLLAALTTFTALIFLILSKAGVIDPLLTFLVTGSLFCGFRALDKEERHFRSYWIGGYLAAALGVLTKGPVALAVPAVVLLCYGFACRPAGSVRAGGWVHVGGIVLLLAVVAGWLIPAVVKGGREYADIILVKQTTARLVDSYKHREPFYYYLLILPVLCLPWTLMLIPAVWSAVREWRRCREPAAVLGLTWFLAIFIFFSCISGKREGYLLPAFPALGLLMGRYLTLGIRESFPWPRAHRVLAAVTIILFGVLAVFTVAAFRYAGPITRWFFPEEPGLALKVVALKKGLAPAIYVSAAAIAALAFLAWRLAMRRPRPRLYCAALVALMLALSLAGDFALAPRANVLKSRRSFANSVRRHVGQADRVCLLAKDFSGVFNLYLGQVSMPILTAQEDLVAALQRPEKVAVIARDTDAYEMLGNPPRIGYIRMIERVGRRDRLLLLTNWDASGRAEPARALQGEP